MRQVLRAGTLGWPRGMGWGGRREGDSGWGTQVHPWLIHVNVWQKSLQYCKVISLQLIKINELKKKKNPPAMWETWIRSLGWEDLLDKGKATHSSILAWRMPWTIVHGVTKSRIRLSNFYFHFQIFINLFIFKLMILSGCINRVVSRIILNTWIWFTASD